MSLVDEFKVACTLLQKTRIPDGEGGWTTTWTDGPSFDAAIVLDSTLNARVAEKQGMTAVYTVTFDRGLDIGWHDAFRRDSDGQVFRVTSDPTDKQTPDRATFQFMQVSAEEWELS